MLHVEGLNFSYGQRQILKDINFEIPNESIVAILGPNGVGKTTLLNCICNIHRPNSGCVYVDGSDISNLHGKEMAKNIGYVPQSVPRTRMTVFDSILLGRKPYFELNASKEDLDKVGNIIAELHMEDFSLRYNTEISGGEFQKIQIARAVVQEPKLLILDEPTNNLDVSNQHITMSLINSIVKKSGISAVMTMHDINLAVMYSDQLIFVNNGRIEKHGSPEIVTPELVKKVYGIEVEIIYHRGLPIVVPIKDSYSLS